MQEKTQFLEQGRMFGAYQVVRELGRGGMGAVYLVRERQRFRRWLFGTVAAGIAAIALVTTGGIWYVRHELDADRKARAAKEEELLPVTADEVSDAVEAVFAIPHQGS